LLADNSRLPVWITLPKGYTRKDVTVSLFLYSSKYAQFIVRKRGVKSDRKIIMDVVAKSDWAEVTKKEIKRRGNYNFSPQYYTVILEGIEDTIGFLCEGPVFTMVDNVVENYTNIQPEYPSIDTDLIGNHW